MTMEEEFDIWKRAVGQPPTHMYKLKCNCHIAFPYSVFASFVYIYLCLFLFCSLLSFFVDML